MTRKNRCTAGFTHIANYPLYVTHHQYAYLYHRLLHERRQQMLLLLLLFITSDPTSETEFQTKKAFRCIPPKSISESKESVCTASYISRSTWSG